MGFLSALGREAPGAAEGLQTSDYGTTTRDAKTNYDQATGKQNDLLAQLMAVQNGTGGPSLAEQQLLRATQANAQANGAAIASQRGINPGLAARQIQGTTAGLNQAVAGQAAENRIKESQGAADLIARILQGQTGTDTSLYASSAGAQNQQNTGQIQNAQLEQEGYKTDLNAAGALLSGIATTGTALATGGLSGLVPTGGKAVPALTPASPNLYGNQVQTVQLPGAGPAKMADGGDVSDPRQVRAVRDAEERARQNARPNTTPDVTGGARDSIKKQDDYKREGEEYRKAIPRGVPLHPPQDPAAPPQPTKQPRRVAGNDPDPDTAFVTAYRGAHQRSPQTSMEMLLAYHTGRQGVANMTGGGEVGGPPPVVHGDDKRNDRTPALLSQGEHVLPASFVSDPDNAALMEHIRRQERAKKAMKSTPGRLMAGA